jgi:hypothetical protein
VCLMGLTLLFPLAAQSPVNQQAAEGTANIYNLDRNARIGGVQQSCAIKLAFAKLNSFLGVMHRIGACAFDRSCEPSRSPEWIFETAVDHWASWTITIRPLRLPGSIETGCLDRDRGPPRRPA